MSRRPDPPRGLGRGLSALLGDAGPEIAAGEGARLATLPVDLIRPNPEQPRRRFDETELDELAVSIRERGVLQPIIVRPDPVEPGHYQIVAGERRWRAAQRAQLHEIPAVLRKLDDRAVVEIAIIENIQRADLNPVEEAQGYAQLIEAFSYTQEDVARVVGKSRSHLANMLRLLALPEDVKALLRDGSLTAGHARALITAPDPSALARETVDKGLTVRQVEMRAREYRGPGPAGNGAGGGRSGRGGRPQKDADTRMLEGDLSAALGMSVQIEHVGQDGGELRIRYRTLDQLDELCQRLAG